jgi:hypothetical protein
MKLVFCLGVIKLKHSCAGPVINQIGEVDKHGSAEDRLRTYAGGAQREIVEEIVNRRNIALTGHDQWYASVRA